MNSGRGDPSEREGRSIDPDGLPYHRGIGRQAGFPIVVRDDCDGGRASMIIVAANQTPGGRRDAQAREIIARHIEPVSQRRTAFNHEVQSATAKDAQTAMRTRCCCFSGVRTQDMDGSG